MANTIWLGSGALYKRSPPSACTESSCCEQQKRRTNNVRPRRVKVHAYSWRFAYRTASQSLPPEVAETCDHTTS